MTNVKSSLGTTNKNYNGIKYTWIHSSGVASQNIFGGQNV